MLKFITKYFRSCFEIVLWVLLLVFVIGGGILGNILTPSRGDHSAYIFIGIILGGIIGFIFVVLGGGLVANFLNMVDNIEKLVKKDGNFIEGKNDEIENIGTSNSAGSGISHHGSTV